mmetsp:Transcript_26584/g.85908  ORF Transcript_26584/g.85908 Transcript_26584/m.85908 type:complete len:209 (+) Transcript_26584:277-903(+)
MSCSEAAAALATAAACLDEAPLSPWPSAAPPPHELPQHPALHASWRTRCPPPGPSSLPPARPVLRMCCRLRSASAFAEAASRSLFSACARTSARTNSRTVPSAATWSAAVSAVLSVLRYSTDRRSSDRVSAKNICRTSYSRCARERKASSKKRGSRPSTCPLEGVPGLPPSDPTPSGVRRISSAAPARVQGKGANPPPDSCSTRHNRG